MATSLPAGRPAPDDELALLGRVIPLAGPGTPDASVVLLRGERIAAVGGPELLADAAARGVPTLDFGERPILPGFVDAHVHAEVSCLASWGTVDCRAPRHRSVADVLQTLADHVRGDGGRDWVVAQGNLFFDQKLADGRLPTRDELDAVCPSRPLALRAGGHVTVLNGAALERVDVLRHAGGQGGFGGAVVETGADGRPTGVVAELDAVLGLPQPGPAELRDALAAGMRELFTARGVTSVGEISGTLEGLRTFDALAEAGEAATRMAVYLWAPGTLSFEEACAWPEHLRLRAGERLLAIRGVKLFADGGYSARNAATRTPYRGPDGEDLGHRGRVSLTHAELVGAVRASRDAGLQLAVHANGERAQDAVCAAVVEAGPSAALPVRVEHAGNLLTEPSALSGWAQAGIVPVPQPPFVYSFGDFFPRYLGDGGRRGRFPFRRLLDEGWSPAAGSDVYLGAEPEQTNPLFGVWCCVRRESFLGERIEPEQAIAVDEALLMHTRYAAEALGWGDRVGSLEPGKLADLVVLEADPRAVPADALRTLRVDEVIVGGAPVHRRADAEPPRPTVPERR